MRQSLTILALCLSISTQAKLNVPEVKINIVDIEGKNIVVGEGNNLRSSLRISQDILRHWKSVSTGTAGFFYPKKHIQKDATLLFQSSNSRNSKEIRLKEKPIRTWRKTDNFAMELKVQRAAYCTKSASEKVVLDLNLTTTVNGSSTSCQELFSFQGSKKGLEEKLNSLPAQITCQYNGLIQDFDLEFQKLAEETISSPENCKDWTTGKKIL